MSEEDGQSICLPFSTAVLADLERREAPPLLPKQAPPPPGSARRRRLLQEEMVVEVKRVEEEEGDFLIVVRAEEGDRVVGSGMRIIALRGRFSNVGGGRRMRCGGRERSRR